MRLARTFAWTLLAVLAIGIGGWTLVRPSQPAIVGKWKQVPFSNGATQVMLVLSDGTVAFDGTGAKYRIVDGNNLVVTYASGQVEVLPFYIEGDRLHVRIGTTDMEYARYVQDALPVAEPARTQ